MKVKTDVTKNYFNVSEALSDCGYERIGKISYKNGTTELYEKNGKKYYFIGMDNFNTTVYSVTLGRVDNLKGEYGVTYER